MRLRRVLLVSGSAAAVGAAATVGIATWRNRAAGSDRVTDHELRTPMALPSRAAMLKRLANQQFDLLIIGGGATGTGIAVDAASRGLNTALVERDDFSSGTSSRSTKLIHGGVRYLEKAFWNMDRAQFDLVQEALHERSTLLKIAPHLATALPIMLPMYKFWQVPYFWAGSKAYDLIAGTQGLKSSYFLSKGRALEVFPHLKEDELVGAMVYYDGQMNDSRLNVALALTAVQQGATVANHTEMVSLVKTKDPDDPEREVITGAVVRDVLTGAEIPVSAKVVVNATGPFTDGVRSMDDGQSKAIVQPSAGIHIVLPNYYSPGNMGLLDPATSDGRVLFFLPWLNHTLAGTTDRPCKISATPEATEDEIDFVLNEIKSYLHPDISVRRGDILAAWTGIRPLVSDPNKEDTQSIARTHIVHVSDSGLVTVAGGKWTTYRAMAADAVDEVIRVGGLEPERPCQTTNLMLVGARGFSSTLKIRVIQEFGLAPDVAEHLVSTYGDRAFEAASYARLTGHRWPILGCRLAEDFPYIEADVHMALKEYACTAIDVIARRTRLAFVHVQAAQEALPRIIEIMAAKLNWDEARCRKEHEDALAFLETTGWRARRKARASVMVFSEDQANMYREQFEKLDQTKDGVLSIRDIQAALDAMGEKMTSEQIADAIAEVDLKNTGGVDFEEFLQLMGSLEKGRISNSRLGTILQKHKQIEPVSVERSGGGV